MYRGKMSLFLIGLILSFGIFSEMTAQRVTDPSTQKIEVILKNWEISRCFDANRIDGETYPHFYVIFLSQWQKITTEESGLVNIEKIPNAGTNLPATPLIFGRSVFQADKKERVVFFSRICGGVKCFL